MFGKDSVVSLRNVTSGTNTSVVLASDSVKFDNRSVRLDWFSMTKVLFSFPDVISTMAVSFCSSVPDDEKLLLVVSLSKTNGSVSTGSVVVVVVVDVVVVARKSSGEAIILQYVAKLMTT